MSSLDAIECFFAELTEKIADKPEVKEWEERMRKYCRAYINNEGPRFITTEDVLAHLVRQNGLIQFPANSVLEVEAMIKDYLSRLGADMFDSQNDVGDSAE